MGLRVVSYAGVESFLGGMTPILERLKGDKPAVYDSLVEFAAETAELPQFRDATDHLHYVVEK
jgi:S-adenosylmethionine-dependent methyltransferase